MLIESPHTKIRAMQAKLASLRAVRITVQNIREMTTKRTQAESELLRFIRKQQLCN